MERISVYHRLVNFSDIEQVESVKSELNDRFGSLPGEVRHFLKAVELKILAAKIFADRLVLKGSSLKIFFAKDAQNSERFFGTVIPNLMAQRSAKIRFIEKPELSVVISLKGGDRIEYMDFAKKILQEVLE
jgi:transcription-repair coupling factor (superfamily II helicase)